MQFRAWEPATMVAGMLDALTHRSRPIKKKPRTASLAGMLQVDEALS
jgi:hypothetical protein